MWHSWGRPVYVNHLVTICCEGRRKEIEISRYQHEIVSYMPFRNDQILMQVYSTLARPN